MVRRQIIEAIAIKSQRTKKEIDLFSKKEGNHKGKIRDKTNSDKTDHDIYL